MQVTASRETWVNAACRYALPCRTLTACPGHVLREQDIDTPSLIRLRAADMVGCAVPTGSFVSCEEGPCRITFCTFSR